jgi:hypothetical protein
MFEITQKEQPGGCRTCAAARSPYSSYVPPLRVASDIFHERNETNGAILIRRSIHTLPDKSGVKARQVGLDCTTPKYHQVATFNCQFGSVTPLKCRSNIPTHRPKTTWSRVLLMSIKSCPDTARSQRRYPPGVHCMHAGCCVHVPLGMYKRLGRGCGECIVGTWACRAPNSLIHWRCGQSVLDTCMTCFRWHTYFGV